MAEKTKTWHIRAFKMAPGLKRTNCTFTGSPKALGTRLRGMVKAGWKGLEVEWLPDSVEENVMRPTRCAVCGGWHHESVCAEANDRGAYHLPVAARKWRE